MEGFLEQGKRYEEIVKFTSQNKTDLADLAGKFRSDARSYSQIKVILSLRWKSSLILFRHRPILEIVVHSSQKARDRICKITMTFETHREY